MWIPGCLGHREELNINVNTPKSRSSNTSTQWHHNTISPGKSSKLIVAYATLRHITHLLSRTNKHRPVKDNVDSPFLGTLQIRQRNTDHHHARSRRIQNVIIPTVSSTNISRNSLEVCHFRSETHPASHSQIYLGCLNIIESADISGGSTYKFYNFHIPQRCIVQRKKRFIYQGKISLNHCFPSIYESKKGGWTCYCPCPCSSDGAGNYVSVHSILRG